MNTSINDIANRAIEWYEFNASNRLYHNWPHACDVITALKMMFGTAEIPPQLLISAAWHDAVYVPGATDGANEKCSAAAVRSVIRKSFPELEALALYASRLIEHTTIEYHLWPEEVTGDLAYLLDADISVLASNFIHFAAKQDDIILEQGGNIEVDRKMCAKFLHQFLTRRPHIYHTEYGRNHWEDTARANITRYCSLYMGTTCDSV